jgi:Immunity protein 50
MTTLPDGLGSVAGAQELADWFGKWPSFHDGEILCLHLNRTGQSLLRVWTWHMTEEVDAAGFYILDKHVVVDFLLTSITTLELFDFSPQNAVFGLLISRVAEAYSIEVDPSYGLGGNIHCSNLSVLFRPGKPSDSDETE